MEHAQINKSVYVSRIFSVG